MAFKLQIIEHEQRKVNVLWYAWNLAPLVQNINCSHLDLFAHSCASKHSATAVCVYSSVRKAAMIASVSRPHNHQQSPASPILHYLCQGLQLLQTARASSHRVTCQELGMVYEDVYNEEV